MASLALRGARRAFASVSAEASSAINVDWSLIRSKMMTDEGRSETDKARESFQRRLNTARSVGEPTEIDWAAYKAKLPELDVDAIRADYEAVQKATPSIPYDAAADVKAHEEHEKAWEGFSKYCLEKVEELKKVAAEQADHKLHRWYRRRRIWQRFPGLYEELHHKVRGSWDREIWGNYIAYKARAVAVPWDANHGEINDEKRRALLGEIAGKTGLSLEQLGYKGADAEKK